MRVKIKTWEEMLDMEGSFIDTDGDIELPCGVCYTKSMENSMPEDRVIKTFINEGDMLWDDGSKQDPYYIEEDMIGEKYELVKITDINIYCDSVLDEDFLDEKDDYIQNLEYENKNMAEFLESLGYSDEQISQISERGNRFSSCPEGSREGEKVLTGNVKF